MWTACYSPSVGGSASAASVSLPFASSTYLERYEGILNGYLKVEYLSE